MPRPSLIRSATLPYHVYARANNKEWFQLPMPEVWDIFMQLWIRCCTELELKIQAFVLMSNHFHGLVTTPLRNLDAVMNYLMRESAKEINRRTGRINHVYGGSHGRTLIESAFHYKHAIRYVYQNPFRKGICHRVEEYSYSTLNQASLKTRHLQLSSSTFDSQDSLWRNLAWLNEPYRPQENALIKKALTHSKFRFPKRPAEKVLSTFWD